MQVRLMDFGGWRIQRGIGSAGKRQNPGILAAAGNLNAGIEPMAGSLPEYRDFSLEGFRLKKLIRAPFMIAILCGLLLFLLQVPLPSIVTGCLSTVAALNTPWPCLRWASTWPRRT